MCQQLLSGCRSQIPLWWSVIAFAQLIFIVSGCQQGQTGGYKVCTNPKSNIQNNCLRNQQQTCWTSLLPSPPQQKQKIHHYKNTHTHTLPPPKKKKEKKQMRETRNTDPGHKTRNQLAGSNIWRVQNSVKEKYNLYLKSASFMMFQILLKDKFAKQSI